MKRLEIKVEISEVNFTVYELIQVIGSVCSIVGIILLTVGSVLVAQYGAFSFLDGSPLLAKKQAQPKLIFS